MKFLDMVTTGRNWRPKYIAYVAMRGLKVLHDPLLSYFSFSCDL